MDKAPGFGSGDCRFESCHGRCDVLQCSRSETIEEIKHVYTRETYGDGERT